MCLMVPGRIKRIGGNEAVIDYEVEERKAMLLDHSFKTGDYVIVQGGVILEKVSRRQAIAALANYKKALNQSSG